MLNIKNKVLLLLVATSILLGSICYAGPAGIVSADQVNLRSSPSIDNSSVRGVLYKDDVVQVLISSRTPWDINGFVRVKVSKARDTSLRGVEGWVASNYLYVPNPD